MSNIGLILENENLNEPQNPQLNNPVMDFYAVLILIIKNNLKDLYHNLLKN